MNRVISIIKEKCIDKKIQYSLNIAVRFCGEELPQEVVDESTKSLLKFEMLRNPDLNDAFAKYAYDLAMDNLVKELGIKYEPDSECDRFEKHLAAVLAKIICR
ncbi:hypothetical protein [Sporofaciens sp. SGI.106]|uniref:hypothetical protein n=1 Tax=Sporofaciens sp. SGI.106 TaxID=3420568 RepID=UPI003D088839